MPKQPRAHTRQAGAALAGASLLTARWVERLLASHDPPLTVAQYLALRAIAAEPLSAADLARRTGVSGPAVSQLVSALESAGLVERGGPLDDPRSRGLALTRGGRRTLESATKLVSERLAELLVDLPRPAPATRPGRSRAAPPARPRAAPRRARSRPAWAAPGWQRPRPRRAGSAERWDRRRT